MKVRFGLLLLLLGLAPAFAEDPADEPGATSESEEAPPVGGLFGLFNRGRKPPAPRAETPAAETAVGAEPTPAPAAEAPARPSGEPKREAISPPAAPVGASPKPEAPAEAVAPAPPPPEAAPAEAAPVPPPAAPAKASRGKADVELPPTEIQGEIEKPDIFFLVPRARDQSDEQLIRARIQREINRPVIKDWVEEEMLLK